MQNPIIPPPAQLSYGNGQVRGLQQKCLTITMKATMQRGKDTDNLNGAVHDSGMSNPSPDQQFSV